MTRLGVDYSMSRPGVAALRAAGYTFACRYLAAGSSRTAAKALTRAEADELRAGGIDIVSNWEIAPGAALNGRAQGVSDAQRAAAAHAACGGPPDRPIYFSVDIDTVPANYPAIDAYFAGIISVLGLARTGVYGEYDLVAHCAAVHEVRWVWQTYAWSGRPTKWFAGANIRQVRNGITVNGADCDKDEAMTADFGQWGYKEANIVTAPAASGGDLGWAQAINRQNALTSVSKISVPLALDSGGKVTQWKTEDNPLMDADGSVIEGVRDLQASVAKLAAPSTPITVTQEQLNAAVAANIPALAAELAKHIKVS